MEVAYQTHDPFKPNFKTITHYKPYKISTQPTIEFKVVYIRIITSSDIQTSMTLNFPPRDVNSCLQINGINIHPNEKPSRPLNKHREDAFMSESVYVNTDRIKLKGKYLPFEVQTQGSCVLLSGVLRRKEGAEVEDDGCMWVMESCKEGDGVKEFNGGSVEACFAGRSLGKPLLLNGVVEFKGLKELECNSQAAQTKSHDSPKELEVKSDEELVKEMNEEQFKMSADQEEMLVEEGELSWFNAGVKLGIGLGVGMSLGVGVGLGLIIRTYKSTSGVLKKLTV